MLPPHRPDCLELIPRQRQQIATQLPRRHCLVVQPTRLQLMPVLWVRHLSLVLQPQQQVPTACPLHPLGNHCLVMRQLLYLRRTVFLLSRLARPQLSQILPSPQQTPTHLRLCLELQLLLPLQAKPLRHLERHRMQGLHLVAPRHLCLGDRRQRNKLLL